MNYRRRAATAKLSISLLLCAFALAAAAPAGAQEQEVPRRPRGPAAGPVIRLPRGEGAQPDAQAQAADAQRAAQPAAPQKWEYCSLTGHTYKNKEVGLSVRAVPTAVIRYFTQGTTEEVEAANHELAIDNAVARLGEEGWELAGVRERFSLSEGTGASAPVFYFKRPKRQE